MIFAYSFSCCLFLAYCLAISRNLFTFAGDKIKNSTNTIFMSYKKIFLWVFALDVIIALVTLFALGLDNSVAIAVLFLAFWGACATGVLALPFLVFKKVRRIGFTLLANVIMFPILMIGCSYIYIMQYIIIVFLVVMSITNLNTRMKHIDLPYVIIKIPNLCQNVVKRWTQHWRTTSVKTSLM